jgi:hypothetical protein
VKLKLGPRITLWPTPTGVPIGAGTLPGAAVAGPDREVVDAGAGVDAAAAPAASTVSAVGDCQGEAAEGRERKWSRRLPYPGASPAAGATEESTGEGGNIVDPALGSPTCCGGVRRDPTKELGSGVHSITG